MLVVPRVLGTTVEGQNPLLDLDVNSARLSSVLGAALDSDHVAAEMRRLGATASYRISSPGGLPPLIVFTVTGSDGDLIRRTSSALVAEARVQLTSIERGAEVRPGDRARLIKVVPPSRGRVVGVNPWQHAGWVFVTVLVLGWALVAVLVAGRRPEYRFDPPPPTAVTPVARRRHARGRRGSATQARTPRSR